MATKSRIFIKHCGLQIALIDLDNNEAFESELEKAKAEAVDKFKEILDIKLLMHNIEKQKTIFTSNQNVNPYL